MCRSSSSSTTLVSKKSARAALGSLLGATSSLASRDSRVRDSRGGARLRLRSSSRVRAGESSRRRLEHVSIRFESSAALDGAGCGAQGGQESLRRRPTTRRKFMCFTEGVVERGARGSRAYVSSRVTLRNEAYVDLLQSDVATLDISFFKSDSWRRGLLNCKSHRSCRARRRRLRWTGPST